VDKFKLAENQPDANVVHVIIDGSALIFSTHPNIFKTIVEYATLVFVPKVQKFQNVYTSNILKAEMKKIDGLELG
jgi:uncharacterized membrane protein